MIGTSAYLLENYSKRHELIKTPEKLPTNEMTMLLNEATKFNYINETEKRVKGIKSKYSHKKTEL